MQEHVNTDQRETSIRQGGSGPFIAEEPAEYARPDSQSTEQENTQELQNPDQNRTAMFEENEATDFRSRWQSIQTDFIDDPRRCVERADELVAETMKRLAQIFTEERERLEQSWEEGDNASTEDLRLAFQRYRSFFDRLLSV